MYSGIFLNVKSSFCFLGLLRIAISGLLGDIGNKLRLFGSLTCFREKAVSGLLFSCSMFLIS